MHTTMRVAVAACAVALLLAFATGLATAQTAIRIRPNETVRNSGSLSFTYNDGMRTVAITCNVALGLRYVSEMRKAFAGRLPEGQIGNIVSARTGGCRQLMTNWEVIFLVNEMNPIPLRYNAFLGVLPNITGLLITALEVGIRIRSPNANCLYQGDLPFLVGEVGGGQRFDQKTFLGNVLPWREGAACPMGSTLEVSGTLAVEPAIEVALAAD
jgi:hypothetical protein